MNYKDIRPLSEYNGADDFLEQTGFTYKQALDYVVYKYNKLEKNKQK